MLNPYTTGPQRKSRWVPKSAQTETVVSRAFRATNCILDSLAAPTCLLDEQLQQRLLGVEAVLGLVEDDRAIAVQHVLRDLLTRVRR